MYKKDLQKVTVIGLGLLGGSVALAIANGLPHIEVVGYARRAMTRRKARRLGIGSVVTGDLIKAVAHAHMVILAVPVCTYKELLPRISEAVSEGCIITDVGSTKYQVHQWARACLPPGVSFVGSHPLAGSEQHGIEFARDDLFVGAPCIVTHQARTDPSAVVRVCEFWRALGCSVTRMNPWQHDHITATISHVPHVVATALVNATPRAHMPYAGKGFIDTSRIASGPPHVWTDVLLTNDRMIGRGIDKVIEELTKLKKAVSAQNRASVERYLQRARVKRATMISNKIRRKELL